MKIETREGVVLDFSEPNTPHEPITVSLCVKGKGPEKIGMVLTLKDEETGMITHQAYNQYHEQMGCRTEDWQTIENVFSKHGYNLTRNEIHQGFVRIAERMNELRKTREAKIIGREINR
jgi:hypothetical protein